MINDNITFKKELLSEQIYNYQHSGHFTEKEIDRLCAPIKLELELLDLAESHNMLIGLNKKSANSFEELKDSFLKMVKSVQTINEREVIDAEILTQNNTQA